MANTVKRRFFVLDGYQVGDRLLEGVDFEIELVQDDGGYSIGSITPAKEAKSYLKNIKWKNFVPQLRSMAEFNLSHTLKWCEERGSSLEIEMKEFAAETGEPGPYLLGEV